MTLTAQGFGAGTKEFSRPNVVRLLLGDTGATVRETEETLILATTNIDDMNPEWLPPLIDRLLAAGALDAWLTPILMKKGRPAHTLSVLCDQDRAGDIRRVVYTESSSLGIREEYVRRFSVPRSSRRVSTPWGEVHVKVADLPDGTQRAAPEFADCARLADEHRVTLSAVYDAALAAWRSRPPVAP
jgi:uncharacterized protein (DUF111 family)